MLKNKKTIYLTMALVTFVVVFLAGYSAYAGPSIDFPTNFADFATADIKDTIENIVRIVVGFIGIIFLLLLLYGGLIWMFSAGNTDKVNRAKKIITSAVIGLLVTLMAYSIANFIIEGGGGAVGPPPSGTGPGPGPGGFGFALGGGVLESHYPGRNATNIPRNVNILVTFKEKMVVNTVCNGGLVDIGSVKIEQLDTTYADAPNDGNSDFTLENVNCSTVDDKTFKFDPVGNLGKTSGNTAYQVTLTNAILKQVDNKPAFGSLGSYNWRFYVSTFADETPPIIISTYPIHGSVDVPANTIIRITFSEAMDPSLASGVYNGGGFENIIVDDDPGFGSPLNGQYLISNQYRTVEFIPTDLCEGSPVNSCGDPVYCLPKGIPIYVLVKDSVVDMANNLLDGDNHIGPPPNPSRVPTGDGTAGTNFDFNFTVSNDLDLIPPYMIARVPGDTDIDADVSAPVESTFNELIYGASVNTVNYKFDPAYQATCQPTGFWTQYRDIDVDAIPGADQTIIELHHDRFQAFSDYCPVVTSDLKDTAQNCYFPAACDNNADGIADVTECPGF